MGGGGGGVVLEVGEGFADEEERSADEEFLRALAGGFDGVGDRGENMDGAGWGGGGEFELVGGDGAGGLEGDKPEFHRDFREEAQEGLVGFVLEDSKDHDGAYVAEGGTPGVEQFAQGGFVVCAIDDNLIFQDLEAARPVSGREGGGNLVRGDARE